MGVENSVNLHVNKLFIHVIHFPILVYLNTDITAVCFKLGLT